MAGADRAEVDTVRDRLLSEGFAFSFYQAVSLLERALEGAPEVGTLGPVERERIRFVGTRSLGFPASDISEIDAIPLPKQRDADGGAVDAWRAPAPVAGAPGGGAAPEDVHEAAQVLYRLHVTFMGLYGPPSPLPPAITESIVEYARPNSELADFLDIFNHRIVSLLYRLWKKYRYYIQFDGTGQDQFSRIVFAILGLNREIAEAQFGTRWVRLMAFSGLLGMYCHSAPMLAGLISHYFDETPVEIEEFCERVVEIAMAQRARLGRSTARLGENLTLGDHIHDVAGKFRVWMGPVDFGTYVRLLPGGDWHAEFRNLVAIALRDPLEFDLGVIIEPEEVPRCTLGKESRSRLGWSAWLGGECKERVKVVRAMHLHEPVH